MNSHAFGPLAVMGGGTMAESIIRGGLAAGVLEPARVIVCEPDAAKRALFMSLGVRATDDHHEAVATRWPLLLAVKPQSFPQLAGQLRPHLGDHPFLAISILAGTPAAAIHAGLGQQARVVRVMPNTAAAVRLSTSAIARGPGATDADVAYAFQLFAAIGTTVLIDESLMNAATAVVGSGPAYLFYLAQAMVEGAVSVGFDAETANRLVRGTITGAARLLEVSTNASPEALRAAVTSKGGTTAAAIGVLDSRQVLDAFRTAMVAARDRGAELAQVHTNPSK